MKLIRRSTFLRMKSRLMRLYGPEHVEQLAERLYLLIGRYGVQPLDGQYSTQCKWSEKDVVLITYGDMVQREGELPLKTLKEFCDHFLRGLINTIHVLPFYPSSSDGGFSVKDYREVDPELGSWREVELLGQDYELMFDLVLNHCSRESRWFGDYVNGVAPYDSYFIEADPQDERLKLVTRPRPHDLLTETKTAEGTRWLWATFSADQLDLNWNSPDVLFEFLDILLQYIDRQARIIRLDAVAFLWKELGTTCMHHEKTHEVIRLMHDLLLSVAPHVILLTETNVPHAENVSYLGQGNEAHMIYNFALPPLLLHALLRGDSRAFQSWAQTLEASVPQNTTLLNFTASHDGIGVRPLDGLVPEGEVGWLVAETRKRGGRIGERAMPDGSVSPYELNITYRDALADLQDPVLGDRRYLCSQAVMLALRGIPAVYFHSLMGEHNWSEGPEQPGGEARDLNRRRHQWEQLTKELSDSQSSKAWIFQLYSELLRTRRRCAAFHPDASQQVIATGRETFALLRGGESASQRVLCYYNFSDVEQALSQEELDRMLGPAEHYLNLISNEHLSFNQGVYLLAPYEYLWMMQGTRQTNARREHCVE